jgi:hypothetical protein
MNKAHTDTIGHKSDSPRERRSHLENAKLQSILANVELLLAHAAESGYPLDAKTVSAIEVAREKYSKGIWTQEIAAEFWPAYSLLCATIKPVTAESINASTAENLNKTIGVYRRFSYFLLFIIVPVSVFLFVHAGMSNDISDKVNSNNELALQLSALLDPPQASNNDREKDNLIFPGGNDILSRLQHFTTTSRLLLERAKIMNYLINEFEPKPSFVVPKVSFVPPKSPLAFQPSLEPIIPFAFKPKPPFESSLSEVVIDAKALEIRNEIEPTKAQLKGEFFSQLGKYQQVRAFAKNVQQANFIIYGAISAYVLPVLYAALGACAYALRTMSAQTMARTYLPSHHVFARVVIALIAGLVVGLFNNFTQGISLSPLAIAFIVGYAVEIFFSFLDAFLETLKKVRS